MEGDISQNRVLAPRLLKKSPLSSNARDILTLLNYFLPYDANIPNYYKDYFYFYLVLNNYAERNLRPLLH